MLDPFSSRLHRTLFVVCCLASMVILFTPSSGVPAAPPGTDKLVHLTLFLALTTTGRLAGLPGPVLVPALVAYAPLSELLQAVLPVNRHGDPADVAMDLVGVLLAHMLPPTGEHRRRSDLRRRSKPHEASEIHGFRG
ncbi:hypothetical protein [Actinopolyspora mortivallis]|uniref:hypothetical protein n=1 Tax=Actinopolyspora mortivallis TaxID=33906 RepID=UPI00037B2EE7|nr:hypothetical protein [Actinopolyspora mortivallis]